jgi:hypothetical protein
MAASPAAASTTLRIQGASAIVDPRMPAWRAAWSRCESN